MISGVIILSPLTWVVVIVTLFTTPLRAAHEPVLQVRYWTGKEP